MWARLGCLLTCLAAGQASAAEFPCVSCHPQEGRSQPATPMAHSLTRANESEILRNHAHLRFTDSGYTYELDWKPDQVIYTVMKGEDTFSVSIPWAFGLGSAGQTFVYEHSGTLHEARVSFYTAINGLDITVGHKSIPLEGDLPGAAGRRLQKLESSRCIACHATTGGGEIKPGVQCERCHQDAKKHASAITSGTSKLIPPKLSQLDADEMSTFCGECHRTWEEIAANGPRNVNNVRFQPYRLAGSKCFEANPQDRRISCTACHNPHQDVIREAAFYDAKCVSCHAIANGHPQMRVCPKARQDCVSCHMPKVNLADAHYKFTDHQIRVPRHNQPYPD
jgi:hypothetical protein